MRKPGSALARWEPGAVRSSRIAGTLLTCLGIASLGTGCDSVDPAEVQPLTVAEDPLPDGLLGAPYSAQLGASGGDGGFVWSIESGTLPGGAFSDRGQPLRTTR